LSENVTGSDALRRALAASIDLIETEREAGHLTAAQAADAARRVRALYDRDVALAGTVHRLETGCSPAAPCAEHDPGSGR